MEKAGLNANVLAKPLWLLAELTYACPLQCPYCSNPIDFALKKKELTTEEWCQTLKQARELGVVQLGLSGGEPLIRKDLEIIINYAHDLGFYINLITSSLTLTEEKIARLKQAGLDTIQISFQAGTKELNNFLAGTTCFDHKIKIAKAIKAHKLPLIFNCVIHKYNIDQTQTILDLALALDADYIELANSQHYGFGFHNKTQLLPSKQQTLKAEQIAMQYQEKYKDKTKIYYILSDYYENRPKACMGGWGKIAITITPDGDVLPCHAARIIPHLVFENVRKVSLHDIWYDSKTFNQYRGFDWMQSPCKTCPERHQDFGGCRCQAYLLTGNAENADPVCALSPYKQVVENIINFSGEKSKNKPLLFRNTRTSKKLSSKS